MPSHDQRAHFPCGLVQAKGALRFGADTLLLASFVHHYCQGPLGRVAELGCGCGAALCALGLLRQELSGLGLEKDPEQCAAARFNLAALGLASNIEILESDFSQEDNYAHLRQSFKLVLANPPYYSPTEGRPCQEQKRNLAMRSFSALELFCKLASELLVHHGSFFLIYPAAKLTPLLLTLAQNNLGLEVIIPLAAKKTSPAKRLLLKARKAAKANCKLLPPLVLHQPKESGWTNEALEFCPWLAGKRG